MLVDSHCHLDLMDPSKYGADLVAILGSARQHGVRHILTVSVDLDSSARGLCYARSHPCVSASVGVHPNARPAVEPETGELAELAMDPGVVAIGETGLDYYRSGVGASQSERFRRHIAVARAVGKPLIVHSREARDDTLDILEEEKAAEVGGVMHCFVEDWPTAQRALDLGFYISFSGIVTFKNAGKLKEVVIRVPLDRLLVETDSPYLAPVPYRGKPNQPAYVRYVASRIAELRGLCFDAVAEASTRNFFTLFRHASANFDS